MTDDGEGGFDWLLSIEEIIGTAQSDTVQFSSLAHQGWLTIDGGDQPDGEVDVVGDLVDLSALTTEGVVVTPDNGIEGTGIVFRNFERLKGTDGADLVVLSGLLDQPGGTQNGFVWADLGAGNDRVGITGRGIEVFLGSGDDFVFGASYGSIIHTGEGNDVVFAGGNVLVTDADLGDRIHLTEDEALTGGIRAWLSESPWTTGKHGVRYGQNTESYLVIRNGIGQETFVQNYVGGPGVSNPTAGIQMGAIFTQAYRIFEPKPDDWIEISFETLDFFWKAMFGEPRKPWSDPLLLDLDGDGLELTARGFGSPIFDIDGDGFAEPTGWVSGDDGFLARDLNQNGLIDDVSELFGDATVDGFAALSALDSNLDGTIDAADTDFAELRIWRDLDQDGVTDAGELQTLTQAGIASIGLTTSAPTAPLNAQNAVTAVGTFTRTDATTGEAFNVEFNVDNFNSTFLGDTTVSPQAALLPQLKGHGTLPDLRVSMTLDPAFRTLVETTLPTLNVADLDALRAAATDILAAWNTPGVTPATPPDDVPALVHTNSEGETVVDDFGYFDPAAGFWKLASGADVRDANDQVIAAPTFTDVINSVHAGSEWLVLEGRQLAFMERYMGEPIPLGAVPATQSAEAISAVQSFLNFAIEGLDRLAVRLAVQGPLEPFFADISYDPDDDIFRPDTARQLIPVYEEIMTSAPPDSSQAQAYFAGWKPILDVVIGNYDRGEAHLKATYDFLFANVVAAYEAVGAPTTLVEAATGLGVPAGLIVTGGPGTIAGTVESEILYLNGGDQTAQGGLGRDVYVVGKNFGTDVIDDVEGVGELHLPDLIRFADIASTEVSAVRVGTDLVITVIATGDQLTIKRQFEGRDPSLTGGDLGEDTGVAEIAFADGVVWDRIDMAYAVADPQATSDTYVGTREIDVLDGGAGDDRLEGGNETDIYRFGLGYGHDTIADQQTNHLLDGYDYLSFIDGIAFDNLSFIRQGSSNDLLIQIAGVTDQVTIEGQFASHYTGPFGQQWWNRIELFTFENGSNVAWDDVLERVVEQGKTTGNDTIYGFDYEDVLDGGAGDDYLSGGNENDTYLFGLGYGADTVAEAQTNLLSGGDDRVLFEAGIEVADVLFSRAGDSNDLVISLAGDTSTLTLVGQFNASYTGPFGTQWWDRVETLQFQDTAGSSITWDAIMQQLVADAKTSGNDTIYGFDAQDTLDGGAGDDLLIGGNENDTYIFGLGYGNDTIEERRDNLLSGDFDIVSFNADIAPGDVLLERGAHRNDLVMRLSGSSDTLTVKETFRSATVASSVDYIEEFHFTDGTIWTLDDVRLALLDIESTAGDDLIRGFGTDDRLDGGAGNDRLEGWAGDDVYVFGTGYGQDTIYDEPTGAGGGENAVEFKADIAPDDLAVSRVGNDLVLSVNGTSDTLTIEDQFLKFVSGPYHYEVAEFRFTDGTVWTRLDIDAFLEGASGPPNVITGTSAGETLNGTTNRDEINGLAGDDTLIGGYGSDSYLYAAGDGNDLIDEASEFGTDTLVFTDLNVSDVSFAVSSQTIYDLAITITSSGHVITVDDQFTTGTAGLEQLAFADGTYWSRDDILASVRTVGTSGDDTLDGGDSAEAFEGGLGNDTISGRKGGDLYIYSSGDGDDVVYDKGVGSSGDTLRLQSIATGDVTLTRSTSSPDDLTLSFTGGGSVKLDEQFDRYGWHTIEQVTFDDGTVWSDTDLKVMVLDQASTAGDDDILGFSSADTLEGGLGNDQLEGGRGGDTYVYSAGDGDDVIYDNGVGSSGDKLQLQSIATGDVTLTRSTSSPDDLTLSFATGGSVKLDEQFDRYGHHTIEQVAFDDGTVWSDTDLKTMLLDQASTAGDDTILGFSSADTLEGGLGNDTMEGGRGSDTYIYTAGDGDDVITDNGIGSSGDKLRLKSIAPAAVIVTQGVDPDDVMLTFAGGGSIKLVNQLDSLGWDKIEQIEFDNGTIWTASEIETMATGANPNTITGTAGNDTLNGTSADETIIGLAGDDTLNSGGGNDTYVYAAGDGNDLINEYGVGSYTDTLLLSGLNPADVELSTALDDTKDLLVKTLSTGEVIRLNDHFKGTWEGIEQIEFADGTVWDRATIQANAWMRGTAGNDTITGSSGDDTIQGKAGDDTLNSGGGNDTYIYAAGDGNDLINEYGVGSYTDTLRLIGLNVADVELSKALDDTKDLLVETLSTGEVIRLNDHFKGTWDGIEQIEFADSTIWNRATIEANAWMRGTSGNDTITGSSGDDTIQGKAGDDTLNSGGGNDTYVYAAGDGNDLINEYGVGSYTDTLLLIGLNPSDVAFSKALDDTRDLLVEVLSTGEVVRLNDHFKGTWDGIEQVQFADSTVWDRATIEANSWLRGSAGNDTITGTSNADTIDGEAGNDTLSGSGGDDTLYGGLGNDVLSGGAGNDSFIFTADAGDDVINGFAVGAASDDVIELQGLAGFTSFADVTAASSQNGADTVIDLGLDGSITLAGIDMSNLHQDDFRFV